MAVVVVTAANTNTRVDGAEVATDYGHWGGSGPAPGAEPQNKYQGTNAVHKKNTSDTALAGIDYDPGSGALDMTAAANALWLAKTYIADFADLNATRGVVLGIGSANNAYYTYVVAGTAAVRSVFNEYPAQGGYIIAAIDPNIAGWRDSTTGSPSLTAVDWFGTQAQFVAGVAKNENHAIDAIDVGTGLQIYAGDGVSADAVFQDLVDEDQGNTTNRWGYITQAGAGAPVIIRGMIEIGRNNVTATATEFTDEDAVVVFPDGYHSAGLFGLDIELGNASTVITLGAQLIGLGSSTTEDTRPDFVATGTAGSLDFHGSILNHRNVTLTSACTVTDASIECELLTQSSADISNTTITTRAVASTATLQDPTFNVSTDLHDCTFVQGGAGHAIEIDTAGTYTLTNITFTGYNASDGQADSTIWVSAGTGDSTINVTGGTEPSIRNTGAGTVTVVLNPVTLKIIVKDLDTNALITSQDVNVLVEADTGGPLSVGTDIIKGFTDINGEIEDTQTYASNQPIKGWARKSTSSPYYRQGSIPGVIDKDNGLTLTILLARDD